VHVICGWILSDETTIYVFFAIPPRLGFGVVGSFQKGGDCGWSFLLKRGDHDVELTSIQSFPCIAVPWLSPWIAPVRLAVHAPVLVALSSTRANGNSVCCRTWRKRSSRKYQLSCLMGFRVREGNLADGRRDKGCMFQ